MLKLPIDVYVNLALTLLGVAIKRQLANTCICLYVRRLLMRMAAWCGVP